MYEPSYVTDSITHEITKWVWVISIDNPNKWSKMKESSIDFDRYREPTEDELKNRITNDEYNKQLMKKIDEDLEAKGYNTRALGTVHISSNNSDHGVMHNGKLDSGKVEDLLDYGLEGAKQRAMDRQSRKGNAFKKVHPRK